MPFLPLDAPRSGAAFQLVATLTAASAPRAAELAWAGATAFRLNASHLDAQALREACRAIRAALPEAPIVVDLQGAKMRLGALAERPVAAGEPLLFALAAESGEIPLPHPELFASVRPGDTLSLDDDRIRVRVESVGSERLEAVALGAGTLKPRKGVNVLEHPVELRELTRADEERLEAVGDVPALAFAFSFMKDGTEADWLRRRVPGATVVGKIERAEALANLAAIEQRVDATWICRGDLGAQLGMASLARAVARLAPRALARPCVMAGQVLEHLTAHAEPTRSEVCHLFDLVERGYAGIVLSDETAVGRDPVGAVARGAALVGAYLAG